MKFLFMLLIVPAFSFSQAIPATYRVKEIVPNKIRFHDEKLPIQGAWSSFPKSLRSESNAKVNEEAKSYIFRIPAVDSMMRAKDTAIMKLQMQIDALSELFSAIPFDTTQFKIVNGRLTVKPPPTLTSSERDKIKTWPEGSIVLDRFGTPSMFIKGAWKTINVR